MSYTITQAAEKLNVSIHTLRYYEKEGLTPFVQRGKLGIRIYTDNDIDWIYMIRCLRDTDMPMKTIREYITLFMQGESTLKQRQALMYSYQIYVSNRISTMQNCLGLINKKVEYYDMVLGIVDESSQINTLDCSTYKEQWETLKAVQREEKGRQE